MRKKSLLVVLLLFPLIVMCACSDQSKNTSQPLSKDTVIYTVADNISIKSGINFDGETVLESSDFIGFSYEFDENLQEYIFTFRLTDDGKKKNTEATKRLAEDSGCLSLWIGDELIVSPKVMEPITGDEVAINMVDLSKDTISGFVEKLEGKHL